LIASRSEQWGWSQLTSSVSSVALTTSTCELVGVADGVTVGDEVFVTLPCGVAVGVGADGERVAVAVTGRGPSGYWSQSASQ